MISTTSELRSRIRQEMPVTGQFAYFDHAAVAPLPRRTAEAIAGYVRDATHKGDFHWPQWSMGLEQARTAAAQLIGGQTSEIALVPNTTHAITLVAEGFDWKPSDNVVVPENEFPSNLLAWRNLARRGVELRLAKVGGDGVLTPENLAPLIDHRTRIVSISWVGFSTGFRCNANSIVDLAHSRGSLVMLDAIQGLGAFPLDVRETPVDFVAADGHKWMLGPEGAGLLYIRHQHLDRLQPLHAGWNSLATHGFDSNSIELKPTAARYEGGSHNMPGLLGWGASLSLLLEFGSNQKTSLISQAILENVSELIGKLTEAGFEVDVPVASENRSGILSVRWPEADAGGEPVYMQARKHLMNQFVVTSVRRRKLRVYNDSDDHDRLVNGLAEFRRNG